MKTFAVALLLGLLAGWTAAEPVPYEACEGAAGISCSAYATLKILTTKGSCTGSAQANCEAVSSSQSKYEEAYNDWWGGGADLENACDSNTIEVAAKAVATAVAEVWTSARAAVSCDGYGTACGYSITNGQSYALGIAEALAQAAAEVVAGTTADAFCYADIRAVSTAIAEASGAAEAAACVEDSGTLEDYNESFVQSVATAIADALAIASASACADYGGEKVTAESKCEGTATSDVEEEVAGIGDVCGGVGQLYACVGEGKDTCCNSQKRGVCNCDNCNGPWTRISARTDAKLVYQDQDNIGCFCQE